MAETLKGNIVIGQSGGPTMVVNLSLVGAVKEALQHEQIQGIYGALCGLEGVLKEEFIDLRAQPAELLDAVADTPSTALGSVRLKIREEHLERIVLVFQAHNVRYFFYIGGNDSQLTCHQISQLAHEVGYEMRVVGIPKTVDNDLVEVDHCPGYGSAARFIATAVACIDRDNEALRPIQIVEAMGRDTGWLAAASLLARREPGDAPHLIYTPEAPFSEAKFLEDVKRVYDEYGRAVVVISEGLRDEQCKQISASTQVDAFGHVQLGGMHQYLVTITENAYPQIKVRSDRLGTLQRSFIYCRSKTDAEESYLVGQMAVRHACEGVNDYMVTLERTSMHPYKCETGLTPLVNVAEQTRHLPLHYVSPTLNDVEESFLDYVQPLVEGEERTLDSGLPRLARLKPVMIPKKLPHID